MITLSGVILRIAGLALFLIAVVFNGALFILIELPYKLELAQQTIGVLSNAARTLDTILGAPVGVPLLPGDAQFVYQLILSKTIELLLLAAASSLCFVAAAALDRLAVIAGLMDYQYLAGRRSRDY